MQVWPNGQITFASHCGTHAPLDGSQCMLPVHVTPLHGLATHAPLLSQTVPACAAQPRSPCSHVHGGPHAPAAQPWPFGHTVFAHRSMQLPSSQVWPFGQTTPVQLGTHVMFTHVCPAGHPP